MSAGHDDGSSLVSIGLGSLVPTALGAVVGSLAAVSSWTPAADSAFSTFFAGGCIGGILAFGVAWSMAWHASVVGILPDRPPTAILWGLVPALLFGATLGPIFGFGTGLLFGQIVNGILLGLYLGPIAGVMGWEISFIVANFLNRGHDDHAHVH